MQEPCADALRFWRALGFKDLSKEPAGNKVKKEWHCDDDLMGELSRLSGG